MDLLRLLASGPCGVIEGASLICLVFVSIVVATPSVTLPISAQYPPAALVRKEFRFQFSQTTFTSGDETSLSYRMQNAPSWISIDGPARTISGTPYSEDIGIFNFGLIASDSTGSIKAEFKLLVLESSAIEASQNITTQLMKHGTLSALQTLSFVTGDSFRVTFEVETFMGPLGIEYFATSADNTPLPAWVQFDPETRSFSGVAPPLVPTPQTFGIRLIASLVPGVSEASITFFLVINDHKLGFKPFERTIMVKRDKRFSYTLLLRDLLLDGRYIRRKEIANAIADVPDWLQFNDTTLDLRGFPPHNAISRDVVVRVADIYEDIANALIHLHVPARIFDQKIGQITAVIGSNFKYMIEQNMFTTQKVLLSVDLGKAASWLHFTSSTLTLHGKVPANLRPQVLHVSITGKSPSMIDIQTFTIRLVTPKVLRSSRVHSKSSQALLQSPTTRNTIPEAKPTGNLAVVSSGENISNSKVGIGLGCTFAVLVAIVLIMIWRKCRRRKSSASNLVGIVNPKHGIGGGGQNEKEHGEAQGVNMPQVTPSPAPHLNFQFANRDLNSTGYGSAVPDEQTGHLGKNEDSLETLRLSGLKIESARESIVTKFWKYRSNLSPRRRSGLPNQRVLTGLGHGRATNNSFTRIAAINAFVDSRDSGSWYTSSSENEPSMRSQIDSFPHTPGASRNAILDSVPENPQRTTIRQVLSSSELLPRHEVDERPLDEKRQSYVRRRASSSRENTIFASRVGKTPPSEVSSKRSWLYRLRSSSVGPGSTVHPLTERGIEVKDAELGELDELEIEDASSENSQAEARDEKGGDPELEVSMREIFEEGPGSPKGKWIRRPSRTNLRWAGGVALLPEDENVEATTKEEPLGNDSDVQFQGGDETDTLKSTAAAAGGIEALGEREYQRLLSSGTLASDESSAALSSRFI